MDKLTLSRYLRQVEVSESTKKDYRQRYEKVQNKIAANWYYVRSSSHIVIQIKIPSEKTNVMYDVLIEFPFGKDEATFRNFRNADIKVFSNCPSFVYGNARVCDRKGFLIKWAKDLYNKDTFKAPEPDKEESESTKDIKYEKSLYFSALYLDSLNAIDVLGKLKTSSTMANEQAIVKYIKSADWAMEKRGYEKNMQKKQKEIEKAIKASPIGKGISHIKSIGKADKSVKSINSSSVRKSSKIKHI